MMPPLAACLDIELVPKFMNCRILRMPRHLFRCRRLKNAKILNGATEDVGPAKISPGKACQEIPMFIDLSLSRTNDMLIVAGDLTPVLNQMMLKKSMGSGGSGSGLP